MCRTIRVDRINDGIPHDHCDTRIPARRITDSLRDRRIILFLQDVTIRDLHRVDNALVHDAERNRVENLRIDRVDRHIARDRGSPLLPAALISRLVGHTRIITVRQLIATVNGNRFHGLSVRHEGDRVICRDLRVGHADRHIALDGRSIPLPRAGVTRLFGDGRVVAVLEGIALRDVHGLDGLPIGHESNFISPNRTVSIPRNSLARADAVCVVGEVEDVLGRAVALGGSAAELAAVLPLHVPEQLRPIRVKCRVAAAVVLEVDAVDGRQQVAPTAVFVGVLVYFARAALVVL